MKIDTTCSSRWTSARAQSNRSERSTRLYDRCALAREKMSDRTRLLGAYRIVSQSASTHTWARALTRTSRIISSKTLEQPRTPFFYSAVARARRSAGLATRSRSRRKRMARCSKGTARPSLMTDRHLYRLLNRRSRLPHPIARSSERTNAHPRLRLLCIGRKKMVSQTTRWQASGTRANFSRIGRTGHHGRFHPVNRRRRKVHHACTLEAFDTLRSTSRLRGNRSSDIWTYT